MMHYRDSSRHENARYPYEPSVCLPSSSAATSGACLQPPVGTPPSPCPGACWRSTRPVCRDCRRWCAILALAVLELAGHELGLHHCRPAICITRRLICESIRAVSRRNSSVGVSSPRGLVDARVRDRCSCYEGSRALPRIVAREHLTWRSSEPIPSINRTGSSIGVLSWA